MESRDVAMDGGNTAAGGAGRSDNGNSNTDSVQQQQQQEEERMMLEQQYNTEDIRQSKFTLFTTLNNLGVSYLRERRYVQSIQCFSEAARFIVDGDDGIPQYENYESSSLTTIREMPTSMAFYLMLDDSRRSVVTSIDEQQQQKQQQKHHSHPGSSCNRVTTAGASPNDFLVDSTYVFQYPIVISEEGTTEEQSQNSSPQPHHHHHASSALIKLSLIVLYNISLAYHRAALDLGSLEVLQHALAHYEAAYRILISENRVLVSQAMVILNNIGHIHRLMNDEDRARACFQYLLTTMIYVQQSGEPQHIHQWESFFSNVIDLIAPSPGSAPAA
mmetsp:Transcript_46649/g.113673  ORF Transcript_46649/g.113673 Transcript_46649/m.113673 type:complete len:331 (+) Transcript_46649:817-1809(+)